MAESFLTAMDTAKIALAPNFVFCLVPSKLISSSSILVWSCIFLFLKAFEILVLTKLTAEKTLLPKYLFFFVSLFSLTILLSLSNIQFEYSFKLAVLTLMNTVNSSAYGVSDFDFQNLHFLTKYFLIFFMIIGRVELLSLLLIAKKFLFKN